MNKWIISILIIAATFRIIALDQHIGALYGDEVSIAYNAWSILNTGKDEFGQFMPIQFESCGDQKNPVYIYIVSVFQIFLGLNEWSTRLPSALAGVTAVWLTYLLVIKLGELTGFYKEKNKTIALITACLLTINPWHIHISRGGYEANLALSLGVATIYCLFCYFQNNKLKYFVFSLICAVLAMYTYYTTKMFLPLLIVFTLVWSYSFLKKQLKIKNYKQFSLKYLTIFVIASLPFVYLALFSQGQARFASINIFSNPTVGERVISTRAQFEDSVIEKILINKPYIWIKDFSEYYLENLSPLFLYVLGDSSLRYNIGNHGMFYLVELPFVLLGALVLFQKNKRLFIFLVTWLLLAPLPTALVGKSYGLRSIAMLPIPMILSGIGIFETYTYLRQKKDTYASLFVGLLSIIFIISFANWSLRYLYLYPTYAYNWYDGMQKDVVKYALQEGNKYQNVIISKYYGKTEMYFAYYAKMNPREYSELSQETSPIANTEMVKFGKYYFGDIKPEEIDQIPPNTLVIAAPVAPYGGEILRAQEDNRPMFKEITN